MFGVSVLREHQSEDESESDNAQVENKSSSNVKATKEEKQQDVQTAEDKPVENAEDQADRTAEDQPAEEQLPEFLSADTSKLTEMDEVLGHLRKVMEYLHKQTEYDTVGTLRALKMIAALYSKKNKKRLEMADVLVESLFVPLGMKMLVYFNEKGIFSADSVWFPSYYVMNILWNFSDSSVNLCKEMCERNVIHYYNSNLTHKPYLENSQNKNVSYVLKSTLSTLQNISRQVPEAKPLFQKENTPEALQPFLSWHDDFHKAVAILTLSGIADEEQNQKFEDTGAIPFIVTAARNAYKNPRKRYRGFTPLELVEGLARLAVNDTNKKKIVDADALPVLVDMLASDDVEEQKIAGQVLWTLCFDPDSKQKVLDTAGCVEALESLAQSEDQDVKKNAEGTLWKLRGEQQHKQTDPKTSANHIFISYNHAHQSVMIEIKKQLQARGFKVWIDVDNMAGSMLEAMAWAVENAWVVLIGMSENYKQSPSCRQEAEYTFRQNKPIVPLMLQRGYRADGWLGILVGAKLYINFDGKFEFSYATNMLLQELEKVKASSAADDVRQETDTGSHAAVVPAHPRHSSVVFSGEQPTVVYAAASQPVTSSAPRRSSSQAVKSWSQDQVNEWIHKHELDKVAALEPVFTELNGRLIYQMQTLRLEAKDVFYEQLTKKMELQFVDILRLGDALDDLP